MTAVLTKKPATVAGHPVAARAQVVVRPAPRREPPFDDEIAATGPGRYDQRLPFAVVAHRPAWRPSPTRPNTLPDPGRWAHHLLVGMIETAAGQRPLHQLASLLSPSVGRGLGGDFDRAALSGRRHWLHRAAPRTVRGCEPAPGVAELSATVQVGDRVRAIALRLEAQHGRWRCTRLQLG